MNKQKIIAMSALFALAPLALASAACAQDFTGPHIELRVGSDKLSADDIYQDLPDKIDGTMTYVSAGYDWAIGARYTLGIEAGIGNSDAKTRVTVGSDYLALKADRDYELLLRGGYRLSDKAQLFAKAGYANSRVSYEYGNFIGTGYEIDRENTTEEGLRLGLGVNYHVTPKVYVSAEYRYTNYDGDVSRNQWLAGLGYRF